MSAKEASPKKIEIEHTIFYALGLISLSGLPAQYDFERGWGVPKIDLTIDFESLCLIADLSEKETPSLREIRVSAGLFEDEFEIDVVPKKGNEGDSDLATYDEVYWVISGEESGPFTIHFVDQKNKTRTEVPKHDYERLLAAWGLLKFFTKRVIESHHQPSPVLTNNVHNAKF